MSGEPILALTAGAQLREVLNTNRAALRAVLARHVAEAHAVGLPDATTRDAVEAELRALDEMEATSRRHDDAIYEQFPHLRPENTPDE